MQALRRRMEVSRVIYEMPKPVVAMVRGPAAGAGLSVALASGAMGAALIALMQQRAVLENWIGFSKFVEVLVFILIGAAIYGIAALLFGAVRLSDLKGMTRKSSA